MVDVLSVIRKAIEASGQTRYRISQETGIAQSQLSRLMSGECGMSIGTVQRLADYLGLELVVRPKRGRSTRKDV
jgi:transcriptional regulator with XRE-family HTH domain